MGHFSSNLVFLQYCWHMQINGIKHLLHPQISLLICQQNMMQCNMDCYYLFILMYCFLGLWIMFELQIVLQHIFMAFSMNTKIKLVILRERNVKALRHIGVVQCTFFLTKALELGFSVACAHTHVLRSLRSYFNLRGIQDNNVSYCYL